MRLNICKIFQRRLYDLFSHKDSLVICLAIFCMTFIAVLHILEIFFIWSHKTESISAHTEGRSCYDFPIDVVYTWVNGSDPKLLADLMKVKQDIQNTLSAQTSADDCVRTQSGETIESDSEDSDSVEAPIVYMNPALNNPNKLFDNVTKFEIIDSGGAEGTGVLIYFANIAKARKIASKCLLSYNTSTYTLRKTHIILGHGISEVNVFKDNNNHKNRRTVLKPSSLLLMYDIPANASTESKLLRYLSPFVRKRLDLINIYDNKSIALFSIKNQIQNTSKAIHALRMSFERRHQSIKIRHPIDLAVYGSHGSSRDETSDTVEDLSESRFADNQELRYSLRSIERNANWVRNVYIVTNGQIPNWLDLENPKIKIITHEEIFLNKSHLPSFSSPAIETHLHRIPGLSKKFLYLNDDILFARPVYPEDFYTKNKGYKVYLSWPVPNCVEGCPMNWLNDGYCDQACNSSQCLWDGGDCEPNRMVGQRPNNLRPFIPNSYTHSAQGVRQETNYCSANCVDSWLSDRFCDQVCNKIDCAFDLGDCGVNNFHLLQGIDFRHKVNDYYYSYDSKAIYFNFTKFFTINKSELKVNAISYENNTFVRSSAFNANHKTLIFLFIPNQEKQTLNITLKGMKNNSEFVVRFQALVSNDSKHNTSYGSQEEEEEYLIGGENNVFAESYLFENKANETYERIAYIESNFTNAYQEYPKILPNSEKQFNISFECELKLNEMPEQLRRQLQGMDEKFKNGLLTEKGLKNYKQRLIELYVKQMCNYRKTVQTFDTTISAFEWERRSTFADISRLISAHEERYGRRENDLFRGRHLLDTYADSLRHVNQLYSRVFGIELRKVPAHMSHFIDVDIMSRLHNTFSNHFDITSSHRIRSSDDMQFAFSYNYYLMSELKTVDVYKLFAQFDVDSSGSWSESEMRTVMINMYELPLKLKDFEEFYGNIFSCCNSIDYLCTEAKNRVNISQYYYRELQTERKQPFEIPVSSVLNCENITNRLSKLYESEKRNTFEILGEEEVSFKMIRSNATIVGRELDQLVKHRTKFMCLNDNIDHKSSDFDVIHIKQMLVEFYESIFPLRSQFELPFGQTNRFLYMQDYRRWKGTHNHKTNILWIIVIMFTIVLVFISKKIDFMSRMKSFLKRPSIQKRFYQRV